MSKPFLSDNQREAGYQRFLEQCPQAQAQVDSVTQAIADALGVELSELRSLEVRKALRDQAVALRIDPFEYLLEFSVPAAVDRQKILLARKESMARALGLE